jgi:hypothetical protein
MPSAPSTSSQRKLAVEGRLDARPGLVAAPQAVAKRLDDVIGGDTNVGRAGRDHAEQRRHHAPHRGHFPAVGIFRGRKDVVVAEQFVGTVDEVDFHRRASV